MGDSPSEISTEREESGCLTPSLAVNKSRARISGYAGPYLIHTNTNPRSRRTCSPKNGDLAHQNSMSSGDSENRCATGCVSSRRPQYSCTVCIVIHIFLFFISNSALKTQVALSLRNYRVGSTQLREPQVPKISPRVRHLSLS